MLCRNSDLRLHFKLHIQELTETYAPSLAADICTSEACCSTKVAVLAQGVCCQCQTYSPVHTQPSFCCVVLRATIYTKYAANLHGQWHGRWHGQGSELLASNDISKPPNHRSSQHINVRLKRETLNVYAACLYRWPCQGMPSVIALPHLLHADGQLQT